MAIFPAEAVPYFENEIYLPLILTILERDRTNIENGPFKLPGPYLRSIDAAIEQVQREMKANSEYMRANNSKVLRGKTEGYFTSFTFVYGSYIEKRSYLNFRLRNRSAELLDVYLTYRANV